MKPERGGRPASERRTKGVRAVKVVFLVQEMAKELMLVDL